VIFQGQSAAFGSRPHRRKAVVGLRLLLREFIAECTWTALHVPAEEFAELRCVLIANSITDLRD
jgi:hypothetical protein